MVSESTISDATESTTRDARLLAKSASDVKLIANKIIKSGQMAYVDPQSCCDMKQPLMPAMRMKGRTGATPDRFLIVAIAMAKAAMTTTGQTLISRSARSDGSESRSR